MQLADCSPPASDRAPQLGQNQAAYLRLKLAFSLNLRRQIFLAVCDDLALRNRIAARLYAELTYPSPKVLVPEAATPATRHDASAVSLLEHRLSVVAGGHDSVSTLPKTTLPKSTKTTLPSRLYPRLVSLNLSLSEPNPMVQIAEWLAEYPPPKSQAPPRSPGFQILGIERLTRQPAPVQKRFLHALQQVEHYLSCLEAPLLLWLPRPWLNAVQQSAPDFWHWHTALFEFEGDPTPVRSVVARLDTQLEPPQQGISSEAHPPTDEVCPKAIATSFESSHAPSKVRSQKAEGRSTIATSLESSHAQPAIKDADQATDQASTDPFTDNAAIEVPQATTPLAPQEAPDNLWAILSHDLALLDSSKQNGLKQNGPKQTASRSDQLQPSDRNATAASAIASSVSIPDHQTDETLMPLPADSLAADALAADALAADALATSFLDATAPAANTSAAGSLATGSLATNSLAADVAISSIATVSAPVTQADSVPAPSSTTVDAADQHQAALALADLILATVAEEAGETPSRQNTSIVQALQQIEQLHLQEAPKATLLAAYQNLGSLCRDRIEQGNASSQHLLLTVCVYEQTLPWLEADSLLWSDVLNDIGNLYWMLSRQEAAVDESLTYLDQAIAAYQQALAKTNPETRPHNYAMIQNNIGSAYSDMARFRTPASSWQQAIAAYELALRYRPLHDDPARYAATQNNLGTAYWNLAQHQQPVRRLKQAIAAYFEALRYYSADCEPMHYAMIQNNLGTAYWNLAQQPQANLGVGTAKGKPLAATDLLQRAIAAYRAALVYRSLDIAPAAYAATQNNLGTAYWQLASLLNSQPDQRYDRLQQAIAAYRAAIVAVESLTTASAQPALSFDPATTYNNLGLAYYQLAIDQPTRESSTQRSANLEASLRYHLHALQAWQAQPALYQTVFGYVIQTIRTFHTEFGTKGQSLALSQVPANLLSEVLKQL